MTEGVCDADACGHCIDKIYDECMHCESEYCGRCLKVISHDKPYKKWLCIICGEHIHGE